MSSAAEQLLEKLLVQQESVPEDSSSPLILFQYSCHVSIRETAAATATSSDTTSGSSSSISAVSRTRVLEQQQRQQAITQAEADLYRRAQLRTPAENAKRALWGGPLWLEYFTKVLLERSSNNLIWVATTARSTPKYVAKAPKSMILQASTRYTPFESATKTAVEDCHALKELWKELQEQKVSQSSCAPIVIESIVPLIQIYGYQAVLNFISKLLTLPKSLLLLPVLTETLAPQQHRQLEDLAHTCLWLSNHTGQVDLHVLRRGVREQDSTVREVWNFEILPDHGGSKPFRLVVGSSSEDDNDAEAGEAPDQINLLEVMNPALNPHLKNPLENRAMLDPVAELTKKTNKIALKVEDDNKPRPFQSSNESSQAPNAPRIFLQDDDPEFEDYDEEDPDDDLDI